MIDSEDLIERIEKMEIQLKGLQNLINFYYPEGISLKYRKAFPKDGENSFFTLPKIKSKTPKAHHLSHHAFVPEELDLPINPDEFKKAKERMNLYYSYKDTVMVPLYELHETPNDNVLEMVKVGETINLEEANEWIKKGRKIFDKDCPNYPHNSRFIVTNYKRIPKPRSSEESQAASLKQGDIQQNQTSSDP